MIALFLTHSPRTFSHPSNRRAPIPGPALSLFSAKISISHRSRASVDRFFRTSIPTRSIRPSAASGKTYRVSSRFLLLSALLALLSLIGGCGDSQVRPMRLLWAEWPPAHALQEVANLYTQQTGVPIEVVRKSWDGAFGDATFAEFRNRGENYDIIIGDSQWLGLGAVGGHYLELTDWMSENLPLDKISPTALKWYCEYPAASRRYYSVPCEADAMAWAYRKDLFEDSLHIQGFSEFLKSQGLLDFPLAPPETWEQLRQIARYFHQDIPGMAGVVMATSRHYDMATMSFEQILWSHGGEFGDYAARKVSINTPQSVAALKLFADLMETTSRGGRSIGYNEITSEFIAGRAAMACNFFAFCPGYLNPTENPDYYDKIGFFNSPATRLADGRLMRAASLGGQGMSINAHISVKRQEKAKAFLKWFSSTEVQRIWAEKGGFTSNLEILQSAEFKSATPYNSLFPEAFSMMRDFWSVPEFDELLKVVQREVCAVLQEGAAPAQAIANIQYEHERILARRVRH
jgi:multiple sugar transport system substrate-binding protein